MNSIVWIIKHFQGRQEFFMRCEHGLPSIQNDSAEVIDKRPIKVTFEIPYFTASRLQVRYLKVVDKSGYIAAPYVRYITKSGFYQIRQK